MGWSISQVIDRPCAATSRFNQHIPDKKRANVDNKTTHSTTLAWLNPTFSPLVARRPGYPRLTTLAPPAPTKRARSDEWPASLGPGSEVRTNSSKELVIWLLPWAPFWAPKKGGFLLLKIGSNPYFRPHIFIGSNLLGPSKIWVRTYENDGC